MNKLLITGWIPDEILTPYKGKIDITIPDKDKINFTVEEVSEMINEFDALFTISAFPFKKDLIEKATSVKTVANFGVGYDNIDVDSCTKANIYVINTPTTVTEPTAELAFAIMMAITKGVVMYDKELRVKKECHPAMFFDRDILLYGKTFGVLGFGRIGQAVARKAKGIGMNVIYYDPFRKDKKIEEEIGAEYVDFEKLIEISDVISCHMPYTKENHHIINKDIFKKMKNTAYFVNAARGPIMCELDLAQAIKEGEIKGAATDVFENEPYVTDELLALDNVVVTPHIGSNVMEARKNMVHEALDGVISVLDGKSTHNIVNQDLLKTN